MIKCENFELRGIEERQGKNGTYHLYHLEDERGLAYDFSTKNIELAKEMKKGTKYTFEMDYNKAYKILSIKNIVK